MPVPTPKPDEEQNDFISRCISTMHNQDPERPNEQNVAICYDAWRASKEEEIMQRIEKLESAVFIPNTESFSWLPADRFFLPFDAKGRLYKVDALHVGETRHLAFDGTKYTRQFSRDELLRLAGGAAGKLVNLDHNWGETYSGQNTVLDADVEDNCLECIIYIEDPTINKLFDEDHIVGASVEYYPREEKPFNGYAEVGCIFAGLALVTDRFGEWGKPADDRTRVIAFDSKTEIKRIPSQQIKRCIKMSEPPQAGEPKTDEERLKAHFGEEKAQQLLDLVGEDAYKLLPERGQKVQTKEFVTVERFETELENILDLIRGIEKEPQEEQWADLPDSDFACIIGEGDDRQRKLPIHDEAHVRNAMARFNQTEGCQIEEVKARICARAKKFDIEGAFEEGGFCYKGETQTPHTETQGQQGLVGSPQEPTLWDKLTEEERQHILDLQRKRDEEAETWKRKFGRE